MTALTCDNHAESSILPFFFSSRRRHTTWNCDWSSDVCSSDLLGAMPHACRLKPLPVMRRFVTVRSEERRVGKEGRARWSPFRLIEKRAEIAARIEGRRADDGEREAEVRGRWCCVDTSDA